MFKQFNSVFFSIYIKRLGVRFYLFIFVFLGGRVVRISSGDWVGMWVGLEVNLFGVVPFFIGSGLVEEVEATLKYYIIQSVGSILLLMGGVFSYYWLCLLCLSNRNILML